MSDASDYTRESNPGLVLFSLRFYHVSLSLGAIAFHIPEGGGGTTWTWCPDFSELFEKMEKKSRNFDDVYVPPYRWGGTAALAKLNLF